MINCCHQQDKSFHNALRRTSYCTAPMWQKSLSGHIRLYCKSCLSVSKSFHNALRRTSYCTAPMCQKSLSGHIRSYCKKLIVCGTNRIEMPLRRCITRRPLNKSDCIAIETCHVFHCAAVSSSDIFGTAVLILRTKKDWH